MKKLIFACLTAAALVSLSACTTAPNGSPTTGGNPDLAPAINPASAPVLTIVR